MQQAWLWFRRSPPAPESIIGICNDDLVVDETFLACVVQELDGMPDTLLLAREVDAVSGQEQTAGVVVDLKALRFGTSGDEAAINCLPTRGLFFRWKDFERIGGFHPRLLPHYLSDYEFTLRAHRKGLRLRVAKTFAIRSQRSTGTGRADVLRVERWRRPAMVFSRRYKENPFAWTAFVLLVVPAWRWPWLILKVWANTVRLIFPSVARSHD